MSFAGSRKVVNTTTKQARIGRDRTELQLRVGSWNDYRATLDVNRSTGKTFAFRANVIWHERESWREFEFYDRQGGALAATYRPFKNTTIRHDSEYADVKEIDWRIQLNGDNLLAEHDLQVTDADQIRPYRYVYQNPRRVSVTSTFSF